jgi:hypothetical protein
MPQNKPRPISEASKSILPTFGFDWFAAADAAIASFAIYQQARTT